MSETVSARLFGVEVREPVWIPVRDGTKLAARIWLPEREGFGPFPAILEYIPYRTFDRYRALDDRWGRTLAQKGIAFVRVDIRGSGNSEGLLRDEYLESEQDDGLDIIAWLAAQPWCNGKIGMRGLSWGGFSALQVAARRPPALKAILPMCATDSRFRNDAHYVGGVPGLTNLKWAAGFALAMSAPPDPAIVGARWENMWRERLEAVPSNAVRWLQHDKSDAYWRHGSMAFVPDAIACPVYLVGGWADPYAQSIVRMLRHLSAPVQAIMGPWGHTYPDLAQPGPSLDWHAEEVRWWRCWLDEESQGNAGDPKFRFYVNYATPAETGMKDIPGRWATEQNWPPAGVHETTLHLAPGALSTEPAAGTLSYKAAKLVGLATPEWIPYAACELPRDQSEDDARSLVFDQQISEAIEIVGVPRLSLRVASDKPLATIAARLSEVDSQGRSWLVTCGLLNLCFRNGIDRGAPSPLEPGEDYDVVIEMNPIAHRFRAGSVLRLSLSDGLWPLVWPSPERATLTFALEGCALNLPVRPEPAREALFPIALRDAGFSRGNPVIETRDDGDGTVAIGGKWPESRYTIEATNTEISTSGPDMELSIDPGDPTSSRWKVMQSSGYRRDDWDCETRVEILMTSTRSHYVIEETLAARKNGTPFFSRTLRNQIPRRFS
jgi:hypothetical protein